MSMDPSDRIAKLRARVEKRDATIVTLTEQNTALTAQLEEVASKLDGAEAQVELIAKLRRIGKKNKTRISELESELTGMTELVAAFNSRIKANKSLTIEELGLRNAAFMLAYSNMVRTLSEMLTVTAGVITAEGEVIQPLDFMAHGVSFVNAIRSRDEEIAALTQQLATVAQGALETTAVVSNPKADEHVDLQITEGLSTEEHKRLLNAARVPGVVAVTPEQSEELNKAVAAALAADVDDEDENEDTEDEDASEEDDGLTPAERRQALRARTQMLNT